jgi:hypothetical protein
MHITIFIMNTHVRLDLHCCVYLYMNHTKDMNNPELYITYLHYLPTYTVRPMVNEPSVNAWLVESVRTLRQLPGCLP